jgi:hypothetical protein
MIRQFVDGKVKRTGQSITMSPAALLSAKIKARALLDDDSRNWITNKPTRQFVKTREGKDSTYSKRLRVCKNLLLLSYVVGDFESSLVFDRMIAPYNAPPPSPDLIMTYLDYKICTTDTPLMYQDKPVLIPGTDLPMMCSATWHCPTNVEDVSSCLKELTILHDSCSGPYHTQTACTDCMNAPKQGAIWGSCEAHANNPVLCDVRRGDVLTYSPLVARLSFWKSKMLKQHVRKGNCQLEPREVRILRTHLVGTRKRYDFQFYVMILTGIRLFLRADEVLKLTVDKFCETMSIVEPTKVLQLCCWIKGKSDDIAVLLKIFEDVNDPPLDLILHLMVYVKCFGIKADGYLFPWYNPAGEEVEYPYSSFHGKFSLVCRNVLKFPPEIQVGTHTMRKSAYLFASWGLLGYCGRINDKGKAFGGVLGSSIMIFFTILCY